LIGPLQKKVETIETPQNRRFYGKMECLPLWPTYIGEKGRTLGKTYGIKARCYWEHLWRTHCEPVEHVENVMGTHWELERNMLGTKVKRKRSPTPKLKRKKSRHFECMLSLPIGCMKFLFSKLFVTNDPIINWWYLFIWRQPSIT
jgi:hypothetical protein